MDKCKFGNKLCSLREEKGLSQKQLAVILDVSDKTISKWENGQSIPRMETFEKIAKLFNISLDVFLTDDEAEMERHKVKRNAFRNKNNGNNRILFALGISSIILVAIACVTDAIVYFCFGKSNLADVF
ncbi:MAG: helix-turn-helix domain-containing protein [Eubacterium sp.]